MNTIDTIKLSNDIISMIKLDKFTFNFVPQTWDDVVNSCSHIYYLETAVRKQNTTVEKLLSIGLYAELKSLINDWLTETYRERKKDYFWNKPQNNPNPLEGIMGEF